ncbi:hypothetical protein FKM82_014751 [Ascaphus truei]
MSQCLRRLAPTSAHHRKYLVAIWVLCGLTISGLAMGTALLQETVVLGLTHRSSGDGFRIGPGGQSFDDYFWLHRKGGGIYRKKVLAGTSKMDVSTGTSWVDAVSWISRPGAGTSNTSRRSSGTSDVFRSGGVVSDVVTDG